MAPRWPQDGPKMALRWPQDASKSRPSRLQNHFHVSLTSRSPKMPSKWPQNITREPQEASKDLPRGLTKPQENPKSPPKRCPDAPKRPHLHYGHLLFMWKGFHFRFVIPSCVQYVAVRPPPGPRSAGFNPAAAGGRYDRRQPAVSDYGRRQGLILLVD